MFSRLNHVQKFLKLLFWGFIVLVLSLFDRDGSLKKSAGFINLKDVAPKARADTPPPYAQGSYGGGDFAGDDCDGGGGCDGGCSLVVEYWNGASFIPFDIYSPRHYQPTVNTVPIPKEAIGAKGEVKMRIRATKRHKVHFAGLIAPKETLSYQTEKFIVSKAYHKREEKEYAEVLNEPYSGEFMRTIPGDTVDVVFKGPKSKLKKSEKEVYVLHAGGIYTEAGRATQEEAGDWVSRLDPESRSFLKKLYSLKTYHDSTKGNTPILF